MCQIKTIKCGNVNCYLIINKNNCILIDTGTEKYREYLYNQLKPFNITLIILTHGHKDHIGNAYYLSKQFNAKIAMNKNDEALSKDNSIRPLYVDNYLGSVLLKRIMKENYEKTIEDFNVDIYLENNMSLTEYGFDCKVISLEGHTNGSIGILVNNTELIAGDTLTNIIKPSPSPLAEDFQKLTKSLEVINELNVTTIYVGHGKSINAKKFFEKETQYVKNLNPFA